MRAHSFNFRTRKTTHLIARATLHLVALGEEYEWGWTSDAKILLQHSLKRLIHSASKVEEIVREQRDTTGLMLSGRT